MILKRFYSACILSKRSKTMKNATTNNPYYPLRNRDAILKEAKAAEAQKKAAKATMAKKAEMYRKVIRMSFAVACLINVAVMSLLLTYFITRDSFFIPIIISITTIMIASFLTSLATSIAKKIWEHKLLKLGLLPPNELE